MASTTDGIFGTIIRYPTTVQEWETALITRSEAIITSRQFLVSTLSQHEDTFCKRWSKKTQNQRERLLRASFNGEMPATHREDFQHYLWTCITGGAPDPKLYHLFLCPQINVEDLSRPRMLPLLLDARTRHLPAEFLNSDTMNMQIGVKLDLLPEPRSICSRPHWVVFTKSEQPAEFARFVHQDEDFRRAFVHVPMDAERGLLALEAQSRIMTLLANIVRNVLHDIDVSQSQPEASSSRVTSSESKNAKPLTPGRARDGTSFDVVPDATSDFESVDILSLEAMYRLPKHAVMSSVQTLLNHRASQKRSDFMSLREDPGYYEARMAEVITDATWSKPALTRRAHASIISTELALTAGNVHQWDHIVASCERFIALYLDDHPHYVYNVNESESGLAAAAARDLCLRSFAIAEDGLDNIRATVLPRVLDAGCFSLADNSKIKTWGKLINIMKSDTKDIEILFGQFAEFILGELRRSSFTNEVLLGELQYFMCYGPGKNLSNFSHLAIMVSDVLLGGICRSLYPWYFWSFLHTAPKYTHLQKHVEPVDEKIERESKLIHRIMHAIKPVVEQHGLLAGRRFDYPCTKKATEKHIATLQRSEANLESLWTTLDETMKKLDDKRELDGLWAVLDIPRQGYRTPDWQPPAPSARTTQTRPTPPIQTPLDTLTLPFRTQGSLTDNAFKKSKRAKLVLEQEAARDVQQVEPRLEQLHLQPESVLSAPSSVLVHEPSLEVIHTLFFVPGASGQRGEISWKDFLQAMNDMGFEGRKLLGSAWAFSRDRDERQRRIHVHQPHPSSKIRFEIARDWGRRLRDAYGWTIDTFQVASKTDRGTSDDNT